MNKIIFEYVIPILGLISCAVIFCMVLLLIWDYSDFAFKILATSIVVLMICFLLDDFFENK